MQYFCMFATILVAAAAQEYFVPPYVYDRLSGEAHFVHSEPMITSQDFEEITHPRFRRGVSMDPNSGDITADHKMDDSRVFGTLGSNDNGLFGKAGYEKNIFNDERGQLDAQAFGRRDLGPSGDSSSLGGALKWKNDNAAASFDISKQMHGPTSWTAAGGGHWPVGKNGDFGLEGTYSRMGGMRDYGGRAVYNHRF